MVIPTDTSHKQSATRQQAEELAAIFPDLMVEAEKIAHSFTMGLHGRRRAGPGETFWQHRPYTFGDAVASIDWRQSARASDRLYIRQNEWEAAASIWLWRDPSASMRYASGVDLPEKHYRANVLATSLSILVAQAGERIGVLGHANSTTHGHSRLFHGRSAPARILENLDHQDYDLQVDIPSGDHIRPGSRIILFSDFLMEPKALASAVQHFTARGASGLLCQILDRAEEAFPFQGRTEFLDTESSDRLIFGSASGLKKSYTEKFNDHQHMLRAISHQTGWPMVTHFTDQPARQPLLFLYEILGAKIADHRGGLRP